MRIARCGGAAALAVAAVRAAHGSKMRLLRASNGLGLVLEIGFWTQPTLTAYRFDLRSRGSACSLLYVCVCVRFVTFLYLCSACLYTHALGCTSTRLRCIQKSFRISHIFYSFTFTPALGVCCVFDLITQFYWTWACAGFTFFGFPSSSFLYLTEIIRHFDMFPSYALMPLLLFHYN